MNLAFPDHDEFHLWFKDDRVNCEDFKSDVVQTKVTHFKGTSRALILLITALKYQTVFLALPPCLKGFQIWKIYL